MKIISLSKIFFLKNIFKAYTEGIYADTPANRKLGRVGMSYAEYAQKLKGEDNKGSDKENIEDKSKTETPSKEVVRSGDKYLKKEDKKSNSSSVENIEKNKTKNSKKAKEINDFLKVFDDTQKNSFAYMYAANSLDSQLSKEFVDEEGTKKENPMFGKLYKVTTYKFHFGDTYKEAVKRKNPDWEVQSKKGNAEKVEGYDMVYMNDKGDLMFPISNFTSTSKYYMKDDSGKMKEITIKDIQPYLKPSSLLYFSANRPYKKSSTGSGVNYRNINVDKIYKLNAGGKTWSNADFIYSDLKSTVSKEN